MQIPEGRFYSKEHEWVLVSGDTAVVGITYYAQDELGDVVFVEMPKIGQELKQTQEFGVVESVKTVSNLYAPLSGKVVEINEGLNKTPQIINEDPYEKGWIIKLNIFDMSETKNLLSAKDYDAFIKSKE